MEGGHAGPEAFVTHVPEYPVLRGPGRVSDPALLQLSYNHNGAPYPDVFASANSYCSHPLPAPPPPEVNMLERPSSSRGPGSKSSTSSSFKYDKRMSRDDSFINTRAGAGTGYKSYALARGQLPTPETSPRSSHLPRKASVPIIRMPTPESIHEEHPTDIGMALGSPTRKPQASGKRPPQASFRARQASSPALMSPTSGNSTVDSLDKSIPRKPSGRWKLFSRFGRRPSDHSHSEVNEQKDTHKPEQSQNAAPQATYDSKMERSNTVSTRSAPRHKPIVSRSQTLPYDPESTALGSKSTLRENKSREVPGRATAASQTHQGSSGPLLDVEIPSITMERYSVMFGSVLQPQPSLLARRQATVQKLKSIDDAVEREEDVRRHDVPRRETSPQPGTRSPTFGLFPPKPPQKSAQALPASPRLRSNTSPALLRSPSKASFNNSTRTFHSTHSAPNHQPSHDGLKTRYHEGHSVHSNQKGKLTIATLERAREHSALSREHQFSPDSSNLVLESPSDLSSPEFEVFRSASLRPRASYLQEPKWQMITPAQHTPSTATSSSTSDRKPSPSSPASSAHSNLTKTSEEVDDLLENASNMNPVELSIARQISISRQQRRMLKPLQTGSSAAKTRANPSKHSPSPRIAMGKNERLAETKSSTPTLIIPEEMEDARFAQHRKSERVVLEGA
ncbi:hypothetical protein GGR54DRAFT_640390 [Hypoxylon sp. NC1633]|nr:hypothetical protein GGR54DRAFT_640390 [Hypoxylon sp. NC1633]